MRHADLWVTYGAEGRARGLVRRLGEAIAGGAARLQVRAAVLSSVNEVLGAAALVVAIAASRAGWLGGAPDGRTLFLFAIAFFLAYRPLRELADARLSLARAQGAYEDLGRFIEHASDVPAVAAIIQGTPAWPVASVELRSLQLAHGVGAALTLRIEAGSIAVLAGPTGIGKTTLLRTLLGLERPMGGEVLFDGRPLGDAPAGPASRPFVWVPQDAPLVADTLAANVALAAAEVGPGQALEALAALETVGAEHLVAALGDGRLGAGGRAVSGGERQWIALARAIATRQPVLLLDEPTSGLDGESQRRVLAAIARLRGKRTVLLVTHRPEPLAIADVVVRFDARGAIERAA
ncbi:MAG TPA: ATP-binding cassette domain-containing protein [Polyangiaceae bacterium]|nr:ATP-binding cassette domain-containing protein [Polyangiaceae bacterium]